MCSTAQFHGSPVFYDTHLVTVFLSKESHGTHFSRFSNREIPTFLKRHRFADTLVHKMLDFTYLLGCDLLEMREIET